MSTVKEPVPCSFYDIPGLQSWLDEMALLGLFLQKFTCYRDMAVFEVGEPKAVRYRLDPVGRSKKADRERIEPYQEAGWTYVTRVSGLYSIYSCGDPSAPELYSDPQSLALALSGTVKKQIKRQGGLALGLTLLLCGLLFWTRDRDWADVLLWESPRHLVSFAAGVLLIPLLFLVAALDIRKLVLVHRTLEQGLPLKAKKRRNRPKWIVIYLIGVVPTWLLFNLTPYTRVQVYSLGETTLSRPWPTLGQLEETGPHPLAREPETDGYITKNDSWFVPVQEYASIDWEVMTFHSDTGEMSTLDRPYTLWMAVQYDQARSPWAARQVYQLRLSQAAKELEDALTYHHDFRVTGLQEFQTVEYSGLDRLETVHFRRAGQDAWLFAALRGKDILVVQYTGFAELEDCLPLFLEALD